MIIFSSIFTCLNYLWTMYGLAYYSSAGVKLGVCLPALLLGAILLAGIPSWRKDKTKFSEPKTQTYTRFLRYGKLAVLGTLLAMNLWLGILGTSLWIGNFGFYQAGERVFKQLPLLGYHKDMSLSRLMIVVDSPMSSEKAKKAINAVTENYGKTSAKLSGLDIGFARYYFHYGDDLAKAKFWLNQALLRAEKYDHQRVKIEALTLLSRVYAKERNWNGAIKFSNHALRISASLNLNDTYSHIRLMKKLRGYYNSAGKLEEKASIDARIGALDLQRNILKVLKLFCIFVPLAGFISFIARSEVKELKEIWTKEAYEATDLSAKVEAFNKLINWEIKYGNLREAELLSQRLMRIVNSIK